MPLQRRAKLAKVANHQSTSFSQQALLASCTNHSFIKDTVYYYPGLSKTKCYNIHAVFEAKPRYLHNFCQV